MTTFHPYPAKRYHARAAPCYVASAEEDAALPPGWVDDPGKVRDVARPTSSESTVPEPPAMGHKKVKPAKEPQSE